MYYVYRYMIGDQWIYVGKSKNNLIGRIIDHSQDKRFVPYQSAIIEYIELGSTSDMDITESMLIKLTHPIINIVDKTDSDLPFVYDSCSLNWKLFKRDDFCKQKPKNNYEIALGRRTEEFKSFLSHIIKEHAYNVEQNCSFGFDFYMNAWELIDKHRMRMNMLRKVIKDPIMIGHWNCIVNADISHGTITFSVMCNWYDAI